MLKNQKGLTLLEILLTLSILSVISLIVWSVLNQGIKYSNQAISKNQMQQEAIIITTKLTKIHQTSSEYVIRSDNSCEFTVNAMGKQGSEVYKVEDSKLCFNVTYDGSGIINPLDNDNEFPVTLTISDKNDMASNIKVQIILTRLKNF